MLFAEILSKFVENLAIDYFPSFSLSLSFSLSFII